MRLERDCSSLKEMNSGKMWSISTCGILFHAVIVKNINHFNGLGVEAEE